MDSDLAPVDEERPDGYGRRLTLRVAVVGYGRQLVPEQSSVRFVPEALGNRQVVGVTMKRIGFWGWDSPGGLG